MSFKLFLIKFKLLRFEQLQSPNTMSEKENTTILIIIQKIYTVFIITLLLTIYNILIHLSLIYFVFYFKKRLKKNKETKETISQRFGIYKTNKNLKKDNIIIHCPSLGETNGAISFVRELEKQNKHNIIITNTTLTGHNQSKKIFKNQLNQLMFPIDLPISILLFLIHTKSKKIIIFESDIWPNFILICKVLNIKLYLINGRMSTKSAKSYCYLYRVWQFLLNQFEIILAYSPKDMQRIKFFNKKVQYLGNTKYNSLAQEVVNIKNINFKSSKKILTCVSIHNSELDELIKKIIIPTHKNYNINIILRHPYLSLNNCVNILKTNNIQCRLHSQKLYPDFSAEENIINIVDVFGEVTNYINASDFIFVGGSLVPKIGGHNVLEAAILEKPIITGKYYENWEDIINQMKDAKAIFILDKDINIILENERNLNEYAKNAKEFFQKNTNNLENILDLIND